MFNILGIFGCTHADYGFPRTIGKNSVGKKPVAALLTGTYVVCLKCGRELPYDFANMKVITPNKKQRMILRTAQPA